MTNTARNEDPAPYNVLPIAANHSDDWFINKAIAILADRLDRPGEILGSPQTVRQYLTLTLADLEHEVFGVIWLNALNKVIHRGELFRGTLTQASVYPREVVKASLQHNAAAAIIYHNHPSGAGDPSDADIRLTQSLRDALALIDVKILDHIIVRGDGGPATSFAERGLI